MRGTGQQKGGVGATGAVAWLPTAEGPCRVAEARRGRWPTRLRAPKSRHGARTGPRRNGRARRRGRPEDPAERRGGAGRGRAQPGARRWGRRAPAAPPGRRGAHAPPHRRRPRRLPLAGGDGPPEGGSFLHWGRAFSRRRPFRPAPAHHRTASADRRRRPRRPGPAPGGRGMPRDFGRGDAGPFVPTAPRPPPSAPPRPPLAGRFPFGPPPAGPPPP